jgi:dienelactone hydrolase
MRSEVAASYDPFVTGQASVAVRTIQARDATRGRRFTCEIWSPPRSGEHPLVVYSHPGGGNRCSASFLCTHLASHGYVVAAMDHSELVAPELTRRDGESETERAARVESIIASRVPDVRFLIDYLLDLGMGLDPARIGLVGHSFGGWTVLATIEVEPRAASVVALAPGGSERPRPGILPVHLTFEWPRPAPSLFLAAEEDVMIPAADVAELFRRAPGPKRMFSLRRADHQHFVDDVEGEHEALRKASLPGDAAWIPAAMRPIAELSSGDQAHVFVRGLTLAHLDATLRDSEAARRFLDSDVVGELAARGIEAVAVRSSPRDQP